MKGNNGQRVPDFEAMNSMNAVSFKNLASNVLKQEVGMRAGWYVFKEDGVEKMLQRRAMQNYLRLHATTDKPPRDLSKLWVDDSSETSQPQGVFSATENWLEQTDLMASEGRRLADRIDEEIEKLQNLKERILERSLSFGKL